MTIRTVFGIFPSLVLSFVLLVSACSNKSKVAPDEVQKISEEVAQETAGVPLAEKTHNNNIARFRDTAVYVDGVCIGVLQFGELPLPLAPTWVKEEIDFSFGPGESQAPRYKEFRRYKFRDYFKAMGVDVAKIKEMHIYGSRLKAAAVVLTGEEVRTEDSLLFRFGGEDWGKPIPACVDSIGDGKCPDQIGTVTVYLDKKPPTRKGGFFYEDDGKRIEGIPYFGEPIRGGIRIYLDNRLVATIKRNKLVAANLKTEGPAAKPSYNLIEFLQSQKVATDKIAEAWVVKFEHHVKKLERAELLTTRFKASPAGSGEILLGKNETQTHAILMFSVPRKPDDLPKRTKYELEIDEEEDE